ncbi:MAG: DNA primase [Deltaproteobacteria bacterium]|nr:DNA primase [Deltaproteobacteria bacterium]
MPKTSFFPESFISQIKDSVNLVSVVSEVVALKKTGRNFQGLCPFHPEKTPSFMVNEEKQIFHCFGCGLGGNVFTFFMHYHHLTFPETVSELAERLRIPLPKASADRGSEAGPGNKEALRNLQALAADFYHQVLMKDKNGQKGREYLKFRKMNRKTAEEFFLGYSPEGWDRLGSFLTREKVPLPLLEQSGLIIKKDKGGHYDRFRNRLIFPIFDEQKRVIGLGGRSLGQETPKYLNSPESVIFNKGRVLYGLPQAAPVIRKLNQAVIVEGYFDLLTLHLQGFKQTVASLGTALGSFQIRKLKGMAEDLVLLFDGDPPGLQAALRSVSLFQQEGVSARIKVLPPDTDPDSYLLQMGPERFAAELEQAEPMMTFFFNQQIKEVKPQVLDQARMVERLVPHLKALNSEVERAYYAGLVSDKLKIPESVLWRSLKDSKSVRRKAGRDQQAIKEEPVPGLEWHMIEAIMRIPRAATILLNEDRGDFFESPEARIIYEAIQETFQQQGEVNPGLLLNQLEDQGLKNRVSALAIKGFVDLKDEEAFLFDLIKRIHLRQLQQQEKALYQEIRSKEKLGITEELKSLLVMKKELLQRRKEILVSSKG